jgi:hypothetical protein
MYPMRWFWGKEVLVRDVINVDQSRTCVRDGWF